MTDPEIGQQPAPEIDPGEPEPGGPDAVVHDSGDHPSLAEPDPVPHDAHPDLNPNTESVPGEMKEGEDTSTEATKADDSGDTDGGTSSDESPA